MIEVSGSSENPLNGKLNSSQAIAAALDQDINKLVATLNRGERPDKMELIAQAQKERQKLFTKGALFADAVIVTSVRERLKEIAIAGGVTPPEERGQVIKFEPRSSREGAEK
jgi:hypothetical protein